MKRILLFALFTISLIFYPANAFMAQEEARAAWQVTNFDITANLQQPERVLNAVTVLTVRNVGRAAGSNLTFRINTKATIKAVTVAGANAAFRAVPETQGGLQRITATLPNPVAANAAVELSVSYTFPVESNTGLAAISVSGSQFVPMSFWYPAANTAFTLRGADTAPFKLTVNGGNVISSGILKSSANNTTVYEQTLYGQPFFVQGEWDTIEGAGEENGITAFVPKGAGAEERKQAQTLIGIAANARSFYANLLGSPLATPVRLVAVRRGSGFNDAGVVLLESATFRRSKVDAATVQSVSETLARLWVGGQTAVRGEGGGMLRDGLVRFLASLFIEKQFGHEATLSELLRERLAYAAVARRDAPLARSTPLDDSYFSSVPNKGAMVWRLIDHRLGRDAFISTLRSLLVSGKEGSRGISLAELRASLAERGGEQLKVLLNQQIDQVTDMDLMIGLPQQRGSEWVSALRNLGSTDAVVTVSATTERGEQLSVEASIPARNFGEAVFKTSARITRAEVDPEKLYPQLDYSNDVTPRIRNLPDTISEASRQFGAQDFPKAEAIAREILANAPRMQEARIILARAQLGQNKIDEAEKLFRSALDEPLPTAATIAWANIGLGEIGLKRGQAAEAAKRFSEAVHADAEYASSLTARAGRLRAEAAASNQPGIDEAVRAFVTQLDQAITSGKRAEVDARVVAGDLVKFVNGIIGSQPEVWKTQVLRTEVLDANLVAVDVSITTRELGHDASGTAVLIVSRAGGGWKLAGIELFEVR